MNADQIISDLKTKFVSHAKEIDAWADGYRVVIGPGGIATGDSYREFVAGWKLTTPPKPAQLAKFLSRSPIRSYGGDSDDFEDWYKSNWKVVNVPQNPPYQPAKRRVWIGSGHPPPWFKGPIERG